MDASDAYTVTVLVFWCVQILLNALIPCAFGKSFANDENGENRVNWTPASFAFSIWSTIYITGTVLWILMLTDTVEPFHYTASYFLIIATTVLNVVWIMLWIHERLFFAAINLMLLAAFLMTVFFLEWGNSNVYTLNVIGIYMTWTIVASLLNLQRNVGNGPVIEFAFLALIIILQIAIFVIVAAAYSTKENGEKLIGVICTCVWVSLGVVFEHNDSAIVKTYFVVNCVVAVAFFTWFGVTF